MTVRRQAPLKELASALGLSVTTVSRALAGYPDVNPATRERVRAAVRDMGYPARRTARPPASGRSDFVGMVLPVGGGLAIDPLLGEFVAALAEEFAQGGRSLFLATVTPGQSDVEVLEHIIDSGSADAFVIDRTEVDDLRVRYLLDRGFPFVTHGRLLHEERRYVSFDTDGEAAFAEAARMLVDLGHRRFALLTAAEPYTFAHLRRRGLSAVLAAAGLPLPDEAVIAVSLADPSLARGAAARLLALDPRPTAIVCVADVLALAVLDAARRAGIAVPDALSVIGFDDLPAAAYSEPPLSTFDPRMRESAQTVAHMVAHVLERGVGQVESRLMEPRFVARGSHGPAPPDTP
ncbi:MAG TPA: LacI family DNA-binding transcriptional regulator [Arenibaculum sp.]|nr:LacI family DNA-binding transcriptional regulator [Arenibaculum sp.]